MAEVPVTNGAQHDQRFSRYVLPELEALLRLAMSLTRQRADAEDLVQDTVLRAYRSIDQFSGEYPRAWLFTIMRRANVDNYRRRRPLAVLDSETLVGVAGAGSPDDDPGERAVSAQFDAVVASAFDALAPRYQEVLRLVDIGGLSYAEAASALRVPVGTIMSRLHRARSRLRGRLAAAGLDPQRQRRGAAGRNVVGPNTAGPDTAGSA
jgi:RNA polymerase sigma-70 factor (ECF subfamily)